MKKTRYYYQYKQLIHEIKEKALTANALANFYQSFVSPNGYIELSDREINDRTIAALGQYSTLFNLLKYAEEGEKRYDGESLEEIDE